MLKDSTVQALRAAIAVKTGVDVTLQKLMVKSALLAKTKDAEKLDAIGIKEGTKIMLIGNPIGMISTTILNTTFEPLQFNFLELH